MSEREWMRVDERSGSECPLATTHGTTSSRVGSLARLDPLDDAVHVERVVTLAPDCGEGGS